MASTDVSKKLLLILSRQLQQLRPNLTKRIILDDAVAEIPEGPRRQLFQMSLEHMLDELIQEGKIQYLGEGRVRVLG